MATLAVLETYSLRDPDFILWKDHVTVVQNTTEIPKDHTGKLYSIWLCMIKNYSYKVVKDENSNLYEPHRIVMYENGRCTYSTASGYDVLSFTASITNASSYKTLFSEQIL